MIKTFMDIMHERFANEYYNDVIDKYRREGHSFFVATYNSGYFATILLGALYMFNTINQTHLVIKEYDCDGGVLEYEIKEGEDD